MNGIVWTWGAAMARCLGLSATLPPFASSFVTWRQRAALATIMATGLLCCGAFPAMSLPLPSPWLLVAEAFLGALMGFGGRCLLEGARAFGAFLAVQGGLSSPSSMDLMAPGRSTALAQLSLATALLSFLACDGHHLVVGALAGSFRLLPPGVLFLRGESLAGGLVAVVGQALAAGIWFAFPIVFLLALGEGLFALMQRAAPGLATGHAVLPLRLLALHLLFLTTLSLALPWEARWIHESLGKAVITAETLVGQGG